MTQSAPETVVIYNDTCPICTREINLYRARTRAASVPVTFEPLEAATAKACGLSRDQAARRLHVLHHGQLYSGVDAFILLWRATPGFSWLARIVAAPGIRPIARLVYDHIAAPALFALHKRRERRAKT